MPLPSWFQKQTRKRYWSRVGTRQVMRQGMLGSHQTLARAHQLIYWYCSYFEPVNEAYNDAVSYFKQHLTQDECKRIWIDSKTKIEDVHMAVLEAKQSYEASKKSKARIWLSKLSSRIMYYAIIMGMQIKPLAISDPHELSSLRHAFSTSPWVCIAGVGSDEVPIYRKIYPQLLCSTWEMDNNLGLGRP